MPEWTLVGRDDLIDLVHARLVQGRSVLLVGPAGVGKSAVIRALGRRDLMIIDPFERLSAYRAARIRRALDHGVVCVGAARTLERKRLGCVGRIVWRFETVRVPPLSHVMIRRLIASDNGNRDIPAQVLPTDWIKAATRLAQGRPGLALAIVEEACRLWRDSRRLPAPATAYLHVSIRRASAVTLRERS